jgi:hypothetical protein
VGCILRLRSLGIEGRAPRLALGVGHGMDGRMKAVMPGKIDESGIIGDTTAGITAVWISLGRRQQPRSARSPAIRSPAAELLVGFQGAIVRVLLQCFRDLRRLCRAKIHVLSISYANPPRPPHPRTRSVFFSVRRAHGISQFAGVLLNALSTSRPMKSRRLHSITSSARGKIDCGNSSPSALRCQCILSIPQTSFGFPSLRLSESTPA